MSGNITFSLHLRDSSPKIKNVVISYSPSSCFKHMSFFLLLNTKEDILKNVGNQTLVVVTKCWYSVEVSGYRQLSGTNILQNIFFSVQ